MDRGEQKLKYLFVFEQALKREKQEWEYLTAICREAEKKGVRVFFIKERTEGKGIAKKQFLHMMECSEYRKNSLLIGDSGSGRELARLSCPLICMSGRMEGLYVYLLLVEGFEEVDVDFLKKVYDRHYALPWEIARTARFLIRESVPEDLESFYEIYRQPSVRRFLPPLSEDPEEEKQKLAAYIREQYGFYDYGIWTVEDAVNGKVVGRAGFTPGCSPDCLEMGYLIREEYRHKGCGMEVCSAILRYAREKLGVSKILLLTDRENLSSIRLAQKLGFRENSLKIPGDMQGERRTKHCFFRKI